MTEEERRALTHQEGDTPQGPSFEQLGTSPELHAMSKEDRQRAMAIGQKLTVFARQNPDTPDGQRAMAMVAKLKDKLTARYREPTDAPDIGGAGTVAARNYADAATFGLSNKVADKITKSLEPEADLAAVHESNARENAQHNLAAAGGQVAGFTSGGPNLLFKAVRPITAGIQAARGAGLGAHAALGALRGAAETAITMPVAGGIRAGIESDAPTLRERFSDAAQGALNEAKNLPLTATVGAGLGAFAGAARGIRNGHSQTARDIQTVEDVGKGQVNPLKGGAHGGYYESDVLKGAHSDDQVGEVARRAGDRVRAGLNNEFEQAGQEYAANRGEAKDSGALARNVDVHDLYKRALQLVKSQRTTGMTKHMLETEVIKPLGRKLGTGMTLEEFNDFRGKLGDLAEPPLGGSTPESRQFGDLAAEARARLKDTALGEVNAQYAERMQKLEDAHRKLGFGGGGRTHTDIEDPVAAKKVANFIAREGQTSVTSGIQDQDAKDFLKLYPQFEQELAAPELLRAAQRLRFTLHPPGGGLHHVASGLVRHNIEPALAGAYRLGRGALRLNPLLQGAISATGMTDQEAQ